jgi:hypothetical protein
LNFVTEIGPFKDLALARGQARSGQLSIDSGTKDDFTFDYFRQLSSNLLNT